MGLRALVGIERAGGTYEARHVQYDGCPTVMVPALSTLVHDRADRDPLAAVAHLLSSDWRYMHVLPGGELVGEPMDTSGGPEIGRLDDPAGDREWAYLIGGHRLHVYIGMFPEEGSKRWWPWACWSLRELPVLPVDEVLAVQRNGYATQWQASQFRTYMSAVRDALREEMR
ncbi:hypothetical protein V6U90_16085 [Micromonospora sp. CPCC 206060]|uniref:hypothetical protein n=1 Tax=Micromonospora sp. CPCC 206060 TaxID=3122406 RepID=UPI002FF3AEAD